MILTLVLAAAAPALPTPAQARDIQCVATLAIVASEQRRAAGWGEIPDMQDEGAGYAAIVGEDVMKTTGETREAVRDRIVAAVARIQNAKRLPRADVDACIAAMRKRQPVAPPPSLPRCAAIMGLAYEAVKARDGLTKDAKDLATLASVLTYRARETAIAAGKSGIEADAMISRERDSASKAKGAPEGELRACASLAAPPGAQ